MKPAPHITAAEIAAKRAAVKAQEIAEINRLIDALQVLRAHAKHSPFGIDYDGPAYQDYLRADYAVNQIDAVHDEIAPDPDPDEAAWTEADFRHDERKSREAEAREARHAA